MTFVATHGASRDTRVPEYRIWGGIKARCYSPGNCNFPRYGARGIAMCPEWRDSFVAFFRDMGPRPSPEYSIDRHPNNDGNYEPGNCRWATKREQDRNKRTTHWITFNGETLCLVDWAERAGINRYTVRDRLERGWDIERTLTEPPAKMPAQKTACPRGHPYDRVTSGKRGCRACDRDAQARARRRRS